MASLASDSCRLLRTSETRWLEQNCSSLWLKLHWPLFEKRKPFLQAGTGRLEDLIYVFIIRNTLAWSIKRFHPSPGATLHAAPGTQIRFLPSFASAAVATTTPPARAAFPSITPPPQSGRRAAMKKLPLSPRPHRRSANHEHVENEEEEEPANLVR